MALPAGSVHRSMAAGRAGALMAGLVARPRSHLHSLVCQTQHREASSAAKMYLGCAVYVSEAQDTALLRRLESVARAAPGACLANLFVDEPYNRSNLTLVGSSVPELAAAVVGVARAALAALDLQRHVATHPRLGTVDHISCHPLTHAAQPQRDEQARDSRSSTAIAVAAGSASSAGSATGAGSSSSGGAQQHEQQQAVAALARAIAQQLGAGDAAVPVLTYGWAHPHGRPLDAIRRELGYFRGAAAGSWQGSLQLPAAVAATHEAGATVEAQHVPLPLAPCFGPAAADPRSGVCCVGAAPWLVNYNVLLHTDDMAAARAVARAVSERGGGVPAVQAMALRHTEGIEVACNLLDPEASPPAAVLAAVQRLATAAGLVVGPAYRTNKQPEELIAAAVAAGL